jgi:DNA-binding CsgD family transcriptional regulator
MRQSDEVPPGPLLTELGDGFFLLGIPELPHTALDERVPLTDTEWQVVRLALRGLSNHAISRERGVALRTVANQLASAYQKLGIAGRRELRASLRPPGQNANSPEPTDAAAVR